MLYFIALLLIIVIIMLWKEDAPIEISKYSKVINHDIARSICEAMSRIEMREDEDIQVLINQGKITKAMIEKAADQILFEGGEFPAEELSLDGRDFAKLVTLYDQYIRSASKQEVTYLLNTLF